MAPAMILLALCAAFAGAIRVPTSRPGKKAEGRPLLRRMRLVKPFEDFPTISKQARKADGTGSGPEVVSCDVLEAEVDSLGVL